MLRLAEAPRGNNCRYVAGQIKSLNFCVPPQNQILQLIQISELFLVVAGVRGCVSGYSVTAVGLDSGGAATLLFPYQFSFSVWRLTVTGIGDRAFMWAPIISITIPRHVKSFVHHVFHIANHFHRFHLKQIRN
jgi:hypothetical protein